MTAPAEPWSFAAGELLLFSRMTKARSHKLGWTMAQVEDAVRCPDVVVAAWSPPRDPDPTSPRRIQWRYVAGDLVALVEKSRRGAGWVVVTVERLTEGDRTWAALQHDRATSGVASRTA